MSNTRIHDIFEQSPTRELEEVQKVNAREQGKNDVREFYETESARNVLSTLGNLIDKYPHEVPRFLYISATFGSGKTHLLKLIGFTADTESELSDLGDDLAGRWPGFQSLRQSISDSHVDRLKPVFLNLLNRDASQEPPLPYLIYEAIGRELGYPTDPNWLLEWAWQLDMNHGDCWEQLQDAKHNGQTFDDVYDERASLRSWLYEVVPTLDNSPFDSPDEVKQSIDEAIEEVSPDEFDPDELVERVEEAQSALSTPEVETELLLGLDEVALFIGDGRHRYREFQETMEALTKLGVGPNPPIIGTGQYPIEKIHEEFEDTDVTDQPWYGAQEPLEGADTEIIVRKRWLQKKPEKEDTVNSVLESVPDLTLDAYGSVGGADPDAIESYPFREYDLALLRRVIQQLMPRGRVTEEEYVQGRALLILVRSLFTRFNWGEKSVGSLVTWDELFDLLVEETTYIPLWVQEMVDKIDKPERDFDDIRPVRVAKALYLLNQVRSTVPSTPENVARLLVNSAEASLDSVQDDVEAALSDRDYGLVENRYVLTETNDHGDEEYLLVSEEQEDILTRASTRAQQISSHRLSAKLQTYIQDGSQYLLSERSRHEVDFEDERKVPLRFDYSVLDPVDRAPTPEYDAIRVRLVADEPSTVDEQVKAWQSVNADREDGEHILVGVDIPRPMIDRLRDVMGMQEVLSEETGTHPDLEADHSAEQRALEVGVRERLDDADVYLSTGGTQGNYEDVFERVVIDETRSVFNQTRFVLTNGITEVDDAQQMARFFRGVDDWPLSTEDAGTLGVDLNEREVSGGKCQEFLTEYDGYQSLRGEQVLSETVKRGGTFRGAPRESISALLITLATANQIALRRDDEYLTDSDEIGRAVRNKTNLSEIQIRFESLEDTDPDQIRLVVETLTGSSPSGSDPDAWLAELGEWANEHSGLVKRTIRGVRREFGDEASLDELAAAIEPAFGGESLETEDFSTEEVGEQAERFARATELFEPDEDGGSLWGRYTDRAAEFIQRYPTSEPATEMQAAVGGDSVPTAHELEAILSRATEHRKQRVREQYERITGTSPDGTSPAQVVADLSDWLTANEESTADFVNEVLAEFDDIGISALHDLFEKVWDGDELSEADLVDSVIVQQTKRYEHARQLLEPLGASSSLWTQLQDASSRLESDYPNHPTTEEINETLSQSKPPSPETVRQLIEDSKDPFEVEARLAELGETLQAEHTDHETTAAVLEAIETGEPPSDKSIGELIDDAERLLDGVDEQLQTIRETLDDLEDGSVVLIQSVD